MNHSRCVSAGLVTLDLQQTVDRLPRPDEKTVASSAALEFGGPAANAAATAALLGAPSHLVTACGRGPVGRLVHEGLADVGVDVVDLARSDEPGPAVSSVLVDRVSGERAVVSTNAAGLVTRPVTGADLPEGAAALLVDGHHLPRALELVAHARARGILVLLDGGSWKDGLERLLGAVDVAVFSADFRAPAGAHPAELALDGSARLAAVSHGGRPLEVWAGDGRRFEVPVPEVRVVDSVGAGDVLHGALLFALAQGLRADAEAEPVLRFATEVASLSCAYAGARGWARDPAGRRRAASLVGRLLESRPA